MKHATNLIDYIKKSDDSKISLYTERNNLLIDETKIIKKDYICDFIDPTKIYNKNIEYEIHDPTKFHDSTKNIVDITKTFLDNDNEIIVELSDQYNTTIDNINTVITNYEYSQDINKQLFKYRPKYNIKKYVFNKYSKIHKKHTKNKFN